jgi:hypothetical protein
MTANAGGLILSTRRNGHPCICSQGFEGAVAGTAGIVMSSYSATTVRVVVVRELFSPEAAPLTVTSGQEPRSAEKKGVNAGGLASWRKWVSLAVTATRKRPTSALIDKPWPAGLFSLFKLQPACPFAISALQYFWNPWKRRTSRLARVDVIIMALAPLCPKSRLYQ